MRDCATCQNGLRDTLGYVFCNQFYFSNAMFTSVGRNLTCSDFCIDSLKCTLCVRCSESHCMFSFIVVIAGDRWPKARKALTSTSMLGDVREKKTGQPFSAASTSDLVALFKPLTLNACASNCAATRHLSEP